MTFSGIYIAILIVIVVFETTFSVINMNKEDPSCCIFKTKCFNSEYEHLPESPKAAEQIQPDIDGNLPNNGGSEATDQTYIGYQLSVIPKKVEPESNPPDTTKSDQLGQAGSNQSKDPPNPNPGNHPSGKPPQPGHRKVKTKGNQPLLPYGCCWFDCKKRVTAVFVVLILVVNVSMLVALSF